MFPAIYYDYVGRDDNTHTHTYTHTYTHTDTHTHTHTHTHTPIYTPTHTHLHPPTHTHTPNAQEAERDGDGQQAAKKCTQREKLRAVKARNMARSGVLLCHSSRLFPT